MGYNEDRRLRELIVDNISLTADEIKEFVKTHYAPEDVFSKEELETWAESNKYTKEITP